jgi:hypothetical protein
MITSALDRRIDTHRLTTAGVAQNAGLAAVQAVSFSGYEATRFLSAREVATTGTSLGRVRASADGSLAADHVRWRHGRN